MSVTRRQSLLAFAGAILAPGFPRAETASPKRGGLLTLMARGEPTTLVPLLDSNTSTRGISTKVVEGLLRFDEKFEPQPLLATGWSVAPDGLNYRFDLRRGVKWHDGQDFTSADVRFSLLAIKRVGPRGRITFANLQDVETPDDHTAVLVLSNPAPYLLRALTSGETPILPAHAYPWENFADSPNGAHPIGTGPFVFVEWQRGDHVLLKRNANYWRPERPYLDSVVVRFAGDPSAPATALETGEADVSFNVGLPDLARLKTLPTLSAQVFSDAYLNNAQLFEFNVENLVLARAEVRRALAHAIDRKFITESIFQGYAFPAGSTIPAALAAYNDEAPFNYPYSLETADRLLDEAGLKRDANGARFTLRLTFIPGDTFKTTAEYVRANFAKLGVKVTILDGDLATFIKRVYYERGFDINLNGISRLFDPTVGVQRLYWSDGIKNPLPYLNAAHYNNPEVDGLFRKAAVESDEAERARQFKAIQVIVGADLPVFATVALPTLLVANKRVHDLINSIDVASGDFSETWIDS